MLAVAWRHRAWRLSAADAAGAHRRGPAAVACQEAGALHIWLAVTARSLLAFCVGSGPARATFPDWTCGDSIFLHGVWFGFAKLTLVVGAE